MGLMRRIQSSPLGHRRENTYAHIVSRARKQVLISRSRDMQPNCCNSQILRNPTSEYPTSHCQRSRGSPKSLGGGAPPLGRCARGLRSRWYDRQVLTPMRCAAGADARQVGRGLLGPARSSFKWSWVENELPGRWRAPIGMQVSQVAATTCMPTPCCHPKLHA